MKDLIHKIINWIKTNYISSMIVLAIVLVVIASIIIVGLIVPKKNKISLGSEQNNFYQYFGDKLNEFEGKVSLENNSIVNITANDYDIYGKTPIYYKDKDGMIIPKMSSIIFYYREGLTYRLPKYSKLESIEGADIVGSNGKTEAANNFFIYDGDNLLIIPKESTLKVNGKVYNLGKYSYVIADINGVTYYDYETKEINVISEQITNATLTIDDVSIDLIKKVMVINKEVQLLIKGIDKLPIYLED